MILTLVLGCKAEQDPAQIKDKDQSDYEKVANELNPLMTDIAPIMKKIDVAAKLDLIAGSKAGTDPCASLIAPLKRMGKLTFEGARETSLAVQSAKLIVMEAQWGAEALQRQCGNGIAEQLGPDVSLQCFTDCLERSKKLNAKLDELRTAAEAKGVKIEPVH